ncbi:hypothetical protein HYH03_000023 [Edaphochlamys debaryana]|uniref:Uncharacterized protein n=1 Tax=Edaphochlamys debaryana TaxID=47281 RepID=A0A835YIF2_9CHLO|nr:hypothetical protein HYH03_000023 [Edaphochlamys debaryana]|eukprot:KAG2501516.1 hypothetical protein HYH03_000023 [Edaphochlamys debaryana]
MAVAAALGRGCRPLEVDLSLEVERDFKPYVLAACLRVAQRTRPFPTTSLTLGMELLSADTAAAVATAFPCLRALRLVQGDPETLCRAAVALALLSGRRNDQQGLLVPSSLWSITEGRKPDDPNDLATATNRASLARRFPGAAASGLLGPGILGPEPQLGPPALTGLQELPHVLTAFLRVAQRTRPFPTTSLTLRTELLSADTAAAVATAFPCLRALRLVQGENAAELARAIEGLGLLISGGGSGQGPANDSNSPQPAVS